MSHVIYNLGDTVQTNKYPLLLMNMHYIQDSLRRYRMAINYVKGDCLFIKENKVPTQYDYLTTNMECDILIIGGGITGAITGYYLANKGINTVLIEKARLGHCSTSITTSLLQYELDSNAKELLEVLPQKDIIKAYELGLFALSEIEKIALEIGNDFFHKSVDCLLYTSKKVEMKQIEEEFRFRKENGFDVELITEEKNSYGLDIKAGVLSKKGGAVLDPYLFTHSLIKKSCELGMRVFENTEAVTIIYGEDHILVETTYGHIIKCKKVVAATGYNTALFTKRDFATKYTTFNIATQPISNINPIIQNTVFRDNCDPYHYFRTTQDYRIILGGEDIRFQPDIDNKELCNKSYDNLEQLLQSIFKDIQPTVEYKYCGAFATTKDNLGFIGPDPDHNNLWYCLGYGANGILFAVLGGYYLSKLYYGEHDPDSRLFQIDRFDRK